MSGKAVLRSTETPKNLRRLKRELSGEGKESDDDKQPVMNKKARWPGDDMAATLSGSDNSDIPGNDMAATLSGSDNSDMAATLSGSGDDMAATLSGSDNSDIPGIRSDNESASDSDSASTSLATSHVWAPSDFSDESDVGDVSGGMGSNPCSSGPEFEEFADIAKAPQALEPSATARDAMPKPVTTSLVKLHTDLGSFHAAHGENAVPKRKQGATPEELSLARRLATLRARSLQTFSGADLAFRSAIEDRYPQPSAALPRLRQDLETFRAQHGGDAIPEKRAGASDAEFSMANRLAKLRHHVAAGEYTGEELAKARKILDTYPLASAALPRLQKELQQFREQHGETAVPRRTAGASGHERALSHRLAHMRYRVHSGKLTGDDLAAAKAILEKEDALRAVARSDAKRKRQKRYKALSRARKETERQRLRAPQRKLFTRAKKHDCVPDVKIRVNIKTQRPQLLGQQWKGGRWRPLYVSHTLAYSLQHEGAAGSGLPLSC